MKSNLMMGLQMPWKFTLWWFMWHRCELVGQYKPILVFTVSVLHGPLLFTTMGVLHRPIIVIRLSALPRPILVTPMCVLHRSILVIILSVLQKPNIVITGFLDRPILVIMLSVLHRPIVVLHRPFIVSIVFYKQTDILRFTQVKSCNHMLCFTYTNWGPWWQSGNTLASHLWGRGSIPIMASSGKAGSCLPLVGSLQYRSLMNCMYWFPLPFQLPIVIWPVQCWKPCKTPNK